MVAATESFLAEFTPDGDLHIPEEARRLLKLEGVKQVAIIADKSGVHFVPLKKTLDDIQGSAKSDRIFSEDFDLEIEEAMEEAMIQKYGRYVQPGDAEELEDENGD